MDLALEQAKITFLCKFVKSDEVLNCDIRVLLSDEADNLANAAVSAL